MTDGAAQFDGWHFKNIQAKRRSLLDTSGDSHRLGQPGLLQPGGAYVWLRRSWGINGTVDTYGDVTAGKAQSWLF